MVKQTTFGSCIRALRLQNKMTQLQLADRLGVTDKAVSKWERDLSLPDIALIPKLADTLGTTVNDLFRGFQDECHPSRLLQVFEMSRDIRMPLHIILGFVEIAKNNYSDPEMLMKYLESIKVSGEYLMTLLNNNLREKCCPEEDPCCGGETPVEAEDLEKYLQERILAGQNPVPVYDFSGKRILIAEDMAINREIAAGLLEQTGAEIEFAEDGQICLEKVTLSPAGYYDLILMDLVMPNMDGLEAARNIRQLPDQEKASIPIFALTTNVQEKDRSAAFDAGMNEFTEKPIFVDRLLETMSRYLGPAKAADPASGKQGQ